MKQTLAIHTAAAALVQTARGQKTDAVTPKGFKKSSALVSASDTCGAAFARMTSEIVSFKAVPR